MSRDAVAHLLNVPDTAGHAKVSDTYWYLTGVPELMAYFHSGAHNWRGHHSDRSMAGPREPCNDTYDSVIPHQNY
jgi:hypothetical protein